MTEGTVTWVLPSQKRTCLADGRSLVQKHLQRYNLSRRGRGYLYRDGTRSFMGQDQYMHYNVMC